MAEGDTGLRIRGDYLTRGARVLIELEEGRKELMLGAVL
jgi:hypothetical protein